MIVLATHESHSQVHSSGKAEKTDREKDSNL